MIGYGKRVRKRHKKKDTAFLQDVMKKTGLTLGALATIYGAYKKIGNNSPDEHIWVEGYTPPVILPQFMDINIDEINSNDSRRSSLSSINSNDYMDLDYEEPNYPLIPASD